MKKRLLLAALALAMVLTLLPATMLTATAAEATAGAPESGRTTVQWVNEKDYGKQKEGGDYVEKAWAWQYKSPADGKTYWASASNLPGIVNGTNASGVYYDSLTKVDANGNVVLNTTSFTLASPQTLSDVGTATTLSINTFGYALNITADLKTVNSLTVTDTKYTTYGGSRGGINGTISRNVTPYTAGTAATVMSGSGFTLNVTGAGIGGINLVGRSNRVTLTDVSVSGAIVLDGRTTVNNANGTQTKTADSQTLTINPKAAAPYTASTVGGAITVIGNNSSVTLNGTNAGSNPLSVTSTGGSVRVDNGSKVGAITVASGDEKATDAPPTVTINDGEAGGISYTLGGTSTAASNFTINANGKVTGPISTQSGTVAIHSANVRNVTVDLGTLTIDGTNGTVGDISLGTRGKTTLNFSGTGYNVGNFSATGSNLTIGSNWPTGRTNTFGNLTLNGYTGQGIKGGIFAIQATSPAQAAWFSPDLQFIRETAAGAYAYYGKRELSTAIADGGALVQQANKLIVMGSNPTSVVGFYNTSTDVNPVAKLGYGALTGIYLPDMINGTPVATWTETTQVKNYSVNEEVPLATSGVEVKMVIQSSGASVSRLVNATAIGSNNADVTVTLSNNQIALSGAVSQDAYAGIKIKFTTDQMNSDNTPVEFDVVVAYDTTNKTAGFSTLGVTPPPTGVTVNKNDIVVGNNTYTLVTTGLAKPAANLKVAGIDAVAGVSGKSIVATVTANMGNTSKQALINAITGGDAEFDWTSSPAMRQSVNLAVATVTNSTQVENWATAAQRAAWNLSNKGKNPDDVDLAGTGYDTVVLESYLAVTVSAYNDSGVMTASLVPSYRVIVVKSSNSYTFERGANNNFTAEGYYVAQTGRALTTPINDLTDTTGNNGAKVKFGNISSNNLYMHQDDTYVYQADATGNYWMTRAGKTGLGTVVFNAIPGLVTLDRNAGAINFANGKVGTYGYDNLQAAVNDTLPQPDAALDKITVSAAYTGSGAIDVSGLARKFTITTMGNTNITQASNNFTVNVDATGHSYTVQLQKDIAPAGGNITVASANGGTASVSANPAAVGSTVTVTLSASAGYVPYGVTVRTASGTNVSVSGSGSTYTFTMPSGAVTVTPSFTQGQVSTNPTVSVSNPSSGSGTAVTSVGGNQVAPGTLVTVSTNPAAGQRTMDLNVTGATAIRTGTNQFQFTVPSGYTNVSVTPVFDANNGTNFSDVWSNAYYSKPVAWAVNNNVTTGTSNYTFSPDDSCTRVQMVTFLWRAAGRPSTAGMSNPFNDVSASMGSDFYNAILWANAKGITQGDGSRTTFNPNKTVTRAEAVTFLYRYAGQPAASSSNNFYDVGSSAYYAQAVTWANNKGITNGDGGATTFNPNGACLRAQIVTFLYRNATGTRA